MKNLISGNPCLVNKVSQQQLVFILILFLFSFQFSTVCSQVTYKGTVISENEKKPLALVTVKLQQQQRDSISNEKGIFEIHANQQRDTLIFSCIGYDIKKIPTVNFINGQTVLLKEDNYTLNEVQISVKKQFEVLGKFSYDEVNYSIKNENQELFVSSPRPIAKLFETTASDFKLEYITLGRFVQKHSPPSKPLFSPNGRTTLFPLNDELYFNRNKHLDTSKVNIYITGVDSITRGPDTLLYYKKIEVILNSYQTLNQIDLRKLNIRPPGSRFFVIIEWLYELQNQTYKIGHKMVTDNLQNVFIPQYTIGYEPFIALYPQSADKTSNRFIKQDGKWYALDKPAGDASREIALSINISYYK
ncbi:carboxypeptidase-like regulatory domain-containing protein [Pedobacter riviphilus]|uniref:Carboxypeptidase-like regulatory domain-containing protein n=1 Tax=Pedobacter riviphilus TaxID=2766984 RepID=A0ABX6TC59_9SPHI|nr:carboxypeptidase-like regulatory domain-containing protein [Pedobacter riviphilus]QNR82892.1 carboxypeptidase-like regulatory domain-containing protein [Pedobacter riviphilus]